MDLNYLSTILSNTLVVDKEGTRQNAEKQLKDIVENNTPGFVVSLLQLTQEATDPSVKQSAAVYLKNTIANNWDPEHSEHLINESDKQIIRENIFPVMSSVPKNIRGILSAVVSQICVTDFPNIWTNIISLIVYGIQTAANLDALDSALTTAHSVLARYRVIETEELVETSASQINNIIQNLTDPLMNVMNNLTSQIVQGERGVAEIACQVLSMAFDVLYDVTCQFGITDQLEEVIPNFNNIVTSILNLQRQELLASEYSDGPLTNLKSNVVSLLAMLIRGVSYEDFQSYIPQYMETTWSALTGPAAAYGTSDELTINCLEFIISVINSPQCVFFDNADTFRTCCEHIILPNLGIFPSDLELMQDEPDSYIAREVEGSNSHTRRRAACDVIRALMKALPHHSSILVSYVQTLAQESDWKKKVVLITLVTAVSLQGNTTGTQRGATNLTNLLPFYDFFNQIIVPVLTPSVPMPPANSPESVLAADAIRFVTTFRLFLLNDWRPIFERLSVWLTSPDHIVSSFSAHALERWISIRGDNTTAHALTMSASLSGQQSEYQLTAELIQPLAGDILGNLCSRVSKEKKPNTHMMLCLMRFCLCVPKAIVEFVYPIVQQTAVALTEACKNPTNPIYNHAMFEVISSTIAIAPQYAAAIEGVIWQQLFEILSKDVVEFVPYSLQIMGQLLDARAPQDPIPEHYQSLIAPLLGPEMYQQPGTIPAAVRLVTAVIRKDAFYLERNNLIDNLLQVFNTLLFLKKHDHDALNIMIALVMALPFDHLGRYINQVYIALFKRLQTGNTPKYTRCLILFFSVIIIHHGVERVVTAVNGIQQGMFWMYLNNIWLKNMQKVIGKVERACCVVALAMLCCESSTLQAEVRVWSEAVCACLRMIHWEAERDDHKSFTPKFLQFGDLKDSVGDGGFVNAFCPLTCAVAAPVNPCPQVQDANAYFKQRISALVHNNPQFDAILRQGLPQDLYALIH